MHEALDPHGTELAYPANIVASQFDQHYVLGPLLFVSQQLLLNAQIFFLVRRSRTRSCNGPVLDVTLLDAYQQFGRGAYRQVEDLFDGLDEVAANRAHSFSRPKRRKYR